MFHLNKQKIVMSFVICLLLGATEIFACGCPGSSGTNVSDEVKNAVQKSTVVFAGKAVGFEYRKGISNKYMKSLKKDSGRQVDYETLVVKFQVERWWKGEVTTEIILLTSEKRYSDGTGSNSSCDYSFKKGESYLIYASGKGSQLRTDSCSRTKLLTKAEADLEILGDGKAPVEKKDEPNK